MVTISTKRIRKRIPTQPSLRMLRGTQSLGTIGIIGAVLATVALVFTSSSSPLNASSSPLDLAAAQRCVTPAKQTRANQQRQVCTTKMQRSTAATTSRSAASAKRTLVRKPAASTTSSAVGGTASAGAGWTTTMFDDFGGSALDESKWTIYEGAGNAGIGTRDREAISVADGEMRITGNGWSAGGMGSKQKQTYGLYEVRARVDRNIGYNTAVLLWPSSERWPIDGEIDISEIFDGDNAGRMGSFVHWGANNQQLWHFESADFTQWHTYGVNWQPDSLTYYLDGREIWKVTEPAAIPHNPHFLAIQLDVSSNPNKERTVFHIDWARISQRA